MDMDNGMTLHDDMCLLILLQPQNVPLGSREYLTS